MVVQTPFLYKRTPSSKYQHAFLAQWSEHPTFIITRLVLESEG